jgi:hypothetical protein
VRLAPLSEEFQRNNRAQVLAAELAGLKSVAAVAQSVGGYRLASLPLIIRNGRHWPFTSAGCAARCSRAPAMSGQRRGRLGAGAALLSRGAMRESSSP